MCGSGLQAIAFAAQEIASGMADLTIGAGTESMTRVQMGSDGGSIAPYITEHYNIIPQGLSAELVAERYGLTRGEIDVFSAVSHRRAAHARGQGWFQREIVPVEVGPDGNRTLFAEDETIRPDTTVEKLGTLKPAFKEGGLITAGSSSQITDGAAGVLLASREKAKALKLKTRAKVVHTACTAVNPTIMLTAPILVIPKLLDAVGLKKEDISVFEINEAFAPVVIATMKELGLDPARVNPNGGAVALGHPLGGTGARLTVSALHELERTGGRYAVISLCIGFGQGIATLIERV
jgi:acetyl-CoA acetyltransferase family protein